MSSGAAGETAVPALPHYLDGMNAGERLAFKAARALGLSRAYYGAYAACHRDLPAIAGFAARHAGQRCFILGGGPSLKLIDPSPLKNEVTFAVNGIFLIYDWLGFKPSYYVVEDFLVYADRWAEIRARVRASTCFFPEHFRHPAFTRGNHHYFRALYDFDPGAGFPNFSLNAARILWIGGTVTYICLQLALYMGFKEVYLVGMDHNYHRPQHVQSVGDVWTSHGDDPNHFHPDYFGAGYRWHDPQVDRMETAYRKARDVYAAHDATVFNATRGGHLEVFARVDYASLF